MLVAERLQKIVQLVNERGSIRVTELSDLCGVTEETIRKDLDKLESEGKLMRSHGGAVSVQDTQQEIPYFERETTNVEEKKLIAMAAVGLIESGDRIILDASTTAWWIARYLPRRRSRSSPPEAFWCQPPCPLSAPWRSGPWTPITWTNCFSPARGFI